MNSTMNPIMTAMTHMSTPPPIRRSPRTVMFRAWMVLVSLAVAGATLLVTVVSWPLKLLITLVFVRGMFAADVLAFRNAARVRRAERLPVTTSAEPSTVSESAPAPAVSRSRADTESPMLPVDGSSDSQESAVGGDGWENDYRNAGSSP